MQLINILFAGAVLSQNVTVTVDKVAECLKANNCNGDVACASKCVEVPNPSHDLAEKTNKCYADCIPANATAADNDKIIGCQAKCLVSFQEHAGSSGSSGSTPSKSGSKDPKSSGNSNNTSSAISYSVISPIASIFVAGVASYLL